MDIKQKIAELNRVIANQQYHIAELDKLLGIREGELGHIDDEMNLSGRNRIRLEKDEYGGI